MLAIFTIDPLLCLFIMGTICLQSKKVEVRLVWCNNSHDERDRSSKIVEPFETLPPPTQLTRISMWLFFFKTVLKISLTASSFVASNSSCLLYTSDAADDLLCVDLGGRR